MTSTTIHPDIRQAKKKSKARIRRNAEVYTPVSLVQDMLAKLPNGKDPDEKDSNIEDPGTVWEEGKTFLDPACGDGSFLVEILLCKIGHGHNPLAALKTIYGADIMRDSVRKCRLRLLACILKQEDITEEHVKAVLQNIVWLRKKRYPQGSLNYDFSFPNKINDKTVKKWMKDIHENHILDNIDIGDDVDLPVDVAEDETPKQGNCLEQMGITDE